LARPPPKPLSLKCRNAKRPGRNIMPRGQGFARMVQLMRVSRKKAPPSAQRKKTPPSADGRPDRPTHEPGEHAPERAFAQSRRRARAVTDQCRPPARDDRGPEGRPAPP